MSDSSKSTTTRLQGWGEVLIIVWPIMILSIYFIKPHHHSICLALAAASLLIIVQAVIF